MLLPCFDDIPRVTLAFGPPLRVRRSLPIWIDEIDSVLRMLVEASRWHEADPPPSAEDWPPSSMAAFNSYAARVKMRIGTYVVFGHSASHLARDSCRQLDGILDAIDSTGSAARVRERGAAKSPLIKNLRDHVFAHTASTADYHKKTHSLTFRISSVRFLASEGAFHNEDFIIGGVQAGGPLNADEVALPAVTMQDVETETRALLTRWWALLGRRAADLAGCNDDDLRTVLPGLTEIIRSPRFVHGGPTSGA